MTKPTREETMHYCEGTWIMGFVLDCTLAKEHRVNLQQSKVDHDRTQFWLGNSGRTG